MKSKSKKSNSFSCNTENEKSLTEREKEKVRKMSKENKLQFFNSLKKTNEIKGIKGNRISFFKKNKSKHGSRKGNSNSRENLENKESKISINNNSHNSNSNSKFVRDYADSMSNLVHDVKK